MKKLILLFIIFSAKFIFAQNNTAVLPEVSDMKSRLDSAMGWMFTDENEWVSKPNIIPFNSSEYNRHKSKGFILGKENFLHLETRNIKLNEKNYLLFVKVSRSISFEYERIPVKDSYYQKLKGFSSDTVIDWYIVERSDFAKILHENTPFNKSYQIELPVILTGHLVVKNKKVDDELLERFIHWRADNATCSDTCAILLFEMFPIDSNGNKSVKFNLKEWWKTKGKANPDLESFRKSYFEADFRQFYKFITTY